MLDETARRDYHLLVSEWPPRPDRPFDTETLAAIIDLTQGSGVTDTTFLTLGHSGYEPSARPAIDSGGYYRLQVTGTPEQVRAAASKIMNGTYPLNAIVIND